MNQFTRAALFIAVLVASAVAIAIPHPISWLVAIVLGPVAATMVKWYTRNGGWS